MIVSQLCMDLVSFAKRGHTSSSARVNICFSTTTLSHLEVVSGITDGSSSSQSASLLYSL